MSNIRPLETKANPKVVENCAQLLEWAKSGQMKMVAAVAVMADGSLKVFEGEGWLTDKLAAASILQHRLCEEASKL